MDFKQKTMLVIIVLCTIGILFIWDKYKKNKKIQFLYNQHFGHDADVLTKQRWLYHWNEKRFNQYVKHVHSSMESAKKENIIFIGLCQDNGKIWIPFWIKIIEYIGTYFRDYRIVFLENDSKDDTRELLLQERKRNHRINVMCDDKQAMNISSCKLGIRSYSDRSLKEANLRERINVLRDLRQKLIERARQKWHNTTYTVIIDWDLIGDFSIEGFFHALSYVRNDITDAIAVNSLCNRQGTWNIFDTFPLIDTEHQCTSIKRHKTTMDNIINKRYINSLVYQRIEPIQVKSGFGGVMIYKSSSIIFANYITNQHCSLECEHSAFHHGLRIMIDPWFSLLLTRNMT